MKNRREFTRHALLATTPLALWQAGTTEARAKGRISAQQEFREKFLASGAQLRYAPHGAHGRAWTSDLEQGYQSFKNHPDVSYAVKRIGGGYRATHNADRLMHGGSMPKPVVAACLLEKKKGNLTREEFQHVVNACDRSVNASWRAMLARFDHGDEQHFERKYRLPDVGIRANQFTAKFYAEFLDRCVRYEIDHGCELLLEAMRRSQYGRGRWYLPRSISYVGGKTGTSAGFKNEGLFLKYRGGSWAIVVFTKNNFGSGGNIWRMGALFGGLFREHVAGMGGIGRASAGERSRGQSDTASRTRPETGTRTRRLLPLFER